METNPEVIKGILRESIFHLTEKEKDLMQAVASSITQRVVASLATDAVVSVSGINVRMEAISRSVVSESIRMTLEGMCEEETIAQVISASNTARKDHYRKL